MNETPGKATPGSAGSDEPDESAVTGGVPEPADTPSAHQGPQPEHRPDANGRGDQSEDTRDAAHAAAQRSRHWSSEQPPPARWTSSDSEQRPGAPTPTRAPRGGGGSGSGGAGHLPSGGAGERGPNSAAAPKPGVIPLRPLRMGEILEAAVTTIRLYWRSVLLLTLIVTILVQLVSSLVRWFTADQANDFYQRLRDLSEQSHPDPQVLRETVRDAAPTLALNVGLVGLLSLLGALFVTAIITIVVSRAVVGSPLRPVEAWREAGPRLPRLLGVTLLVPLIISVVLCVGLGVGLLAANLLPGAAGASVAFLAIAAGGLASIYLGITLSLAGPALMLEKQSVGKAMSRSLRLVRGAWWRIFGIQLVVFLIAMLLTNVIGLPFNTIATLLFDTDGSTASQLGFELANAVGGVVGLLISYPLSASVAALLYTDQRMRRENLDVDLAHAAGVTGAP